MTILAGVIAPGMHALAQGPENTQSSSVGGALWTVVSFALGAFLTVFWFMMIVHAAKNRKAAWIFINIFTGIIGAVVYYFLVKRPMRYADRSALNMTTEATFPEISSSGAAPSASVNAEPIPAAATVSPELSGYIETGRAGGHDDASLRKALVDSGWDADNVDRALKS